MKRIFTIIFLSVCLTATGQEAGLPMNLQGVKKIVIQLDSAVTAMTEWEPEESSYETEAKARDIWEKFKNHIEADKYDAALDLYKDGNQGDFLVYLKHSSHRYLFYSQVLRPLMQEYDGDDLALEQYISNLQLEKAMEDFSIELQADGNGYIPEVYPFVIRDLGYGLVVTGKMDEAQELFKNLIDGVYGLTGDALYANLVGTQYVAKLYSLDGNVGWAIETWKNFKSFLEENQSDYDEEDLHAVFVLIQNELDKLTE